MLEQVLETIRRHGMLEPGQRVGVAVSGGADSVCLLHVLLSLAARMDWQFTVLHMDHGLRGEESRGDAEFVRRLAESLNLPFVLEKANLTGMGNLEQEARRARTAFFREAIDSGQVDRVAVGHTRSDQAETVLYHFLRGSGTTGLAAIRPVISPGIVRPLIDVSRAEVEAWLSSHTLSWRNDSTNASPRFARNRIRHELLPQLERDWNPAIQDVLVHTAQWARDDDDYWNAEIRRLADGIMEERDGAILIRVKALTELAPAVARRMVRHAMERARGGLRSIDFRHVQAAFTLVQQSKGEGRCSIPGLEVRRSLDWLRFAKPSVSCGFRFPVMPPCTVAIPGSGSSVSLELLEKSETFGLSVNVYNDEMGYLDWDRLSGVLELRNWQPGDQYQPTGCTGSKKVKSLFQQARIPVWERSCWPVLLDRSTLVWTRRFGPAAEFAAGEMTRIALRIRETKRGE